MEKKESEQIPMLFIRIPQSYQDEMGSLFLYELTRGYWRVNEAKVNDVEKWPYAASVFKDKILEVYKIDAWQKGSDAVMLTRIPTAKDKRRYVFTGTLAPKDIRKKFVGKSVVSFQKGDRSPVRYVELTNEVE